MAWIESHQEIAQHPKTRKLARRLSVSIPAAVGHVTILWHWALTHAFDGDLTGYDPEDIALGALWDGDPDDFITALVEAKGRSGHGFLERDANGLRLHDWQSYTAHLRLRKESAEKANHVRWHSNRKISDPSCRWCRTPNGNPNGVERESTQPNQTVPDLPNLTSPTSPAVGGENGASAEGQKHDPELAAYLVGEGWDMDDVEAAMKRLAARQRFGEPIKDPVAWLTPWLETMAATRSAETVGPAAVEIDGVRHEFVDGEWREVAAL